MGRSKGDGSRSKTRASSSSQAASLMQTSASSAIGFGGFVGRARVDVVPVEGEHLLDVDGDAFLHLKRLSKKDQMTKLKALAALTLFFKDRPATELSTLLPSWVFEYKRLVQDGSRQVRHSTHVAMSSLATSVGRGLAPHLRSLMGPWWVAQFDPAREVSEAAKSSFQTAFPGQKKRLEALMFCENEIFTHLDESLKLTPQTISDKATPIEESTEKYERVVSCSLLALAAIIDVLVGTASTSLGQETAANVIDGEAAAKMKEIARKEGTQLCHNHKFLQQFLKTKSSRIRSATYQALRSFLEHLPQLFREEDIDVVVPSILGTFSEKDPACHQPMWDMVLLFTSNFPQAWGASVVKTTVFPQLWEFLRHGCYGSQQVSYGYLPLLISLIPPHAVVPAKSFFLEYFNSLWHGQVIPHAGSSNGAPLLKAVQACLIWTVRNAKRFSDEEGYAAVDLQIALIDGVIIKLLWYDYVGTYPNQKTPILNSTLDSNLSKVLSDSTSSNKTSAITVQRDPSSQSRQKLASYIVDSIQTLSGLGNEMMVAFWDEFQGFCLQIVQEAGNLGQSFVEEDVYISRIADFLIVLGRKTSKGESWEEWSLIHAVQPFVAKSFPIIRSLGHPESVRLIAKLTRTYGPIVFSLLAMSSASRKDQIHQGQPKVLEEDDNLVQYFKKDVLPWCVDGSGDLNDPKAEVVLAFVKNQRFHGEWELLLADITAWRDNKEGRVDIKQVEVLATLLEKIRENRDLSPMQYDKMQMDDIIPFDWWKCPRIDDAAVKVASSKDLAHPACIRFLRSALGGTSSGSAFLPLVSDTAGMQVLDILLSRLLRILSASPTKWIRSVPNVIMELGVSDSFDLLDHEEITEDDLVLGASAIHVIGSCVFSLPNLDNENTVGGKLLAAIFCLNWAYFDADGIDDPVDSAEEYDTDFESDDESGLDNVASSHEIPSDLHQIEDIDPALNDEPSLKLELAWGKLQEALLSIRHLVSPLFCANFTASTRFQLRSILSKILRLAVLDDHFETPQRSAVRCATWSQEVMGYTCVSPDDTSQFVDLLLASVDSWPCWVLAPAPVDNKKWMKVPMWKAQQDLSETQRQQNDRFASFIDHLSKILSPEEVFLGSGLLLGTEVGSENESVDNFAEDSKLHGQMARVWLMVEVLCTWEWPGGSAMVHAIPFLCSFASSREGSAGRIFLWDSIQALFLGSSNFTTSAKQSHVPSTSREDYFSCTEDPFLRALLTLLKSLLEREDGWSKFDARDLFRQHIVTLDAVDLVSPSCDVQILPHVLSVLMPHLRKRSSETSGESSEKEWQSFLQTAVSVWLQKAMTGPPLVAYNHCTEISDSQWTRVAVACFPLSTAGGSGAMASASSAQVTFQELELLLALLRKQFSREAVASLAAFAATDRMSTENAPAKMKRNQVVEVTLAKLVAAAVGYCWVDFGVEEWEFILKRLRGWLQETVVEVEEFTESVVDVLKENPENAESKDAISKARDLEDVLTSKTISTVELSSIAVAIFSLLKGLCNLDRVDSSKVQTTAAKMAAADWQALEIRALEDILRILLAIGLAESSAGDNGRNVIALHRKSQVQLWDNVADVALGASSQAREAAIRAVDLWGVGNGAISSLYALLFSTHPIISLQWVAYQFLSTGQILHLAITYGTVETKSKVNDMRVEEEEDKDRGEERKEDDSQDLLPAVVAQIRPELSSILEVSRMEILRTPLTSTLRVSYLLGWSLLLTRLQSLTALSPTRERLVQYIQDSDISPTLLDCLFQHIPLEQRRQTSASRRRSLATAVKISSAAAPAKRAAATGAAGFAVEGLWPVQKDGLVTLCGALYGLMLLVLPACVRLWFLGLRDKALASAVEAFTTTHCSPQLLADEFAQVQASAVDEENLSIRANRSLREVLAIYKKEEAGMDIVIRIPACYPLQAVIVECTRQIGINETLLRKWILSMASFLRNQNGAVAEAVQMWKKNVDREFEGVEECPICYSIIHTSNHNLPRLACKTCRHKFHSACLYKWFSTSHQSTCPLCKTPF